MRLMAFPQMIKNVPIILREKPGCEFKLTPLNTLASHAVFLLLKPGTPLRNKSLMLHICVWPTKRNTVGPMSGTLQPL